MADRLLKNSAIYSVIQVLQKAMGFFLLPVYTHFLAVEELGQANIVLSVASFLGIICSLGLNGAGTRFTYESGIGSEGVRTLWGTIFWFSLPYSLVSTGILFLAIKPIGSFLAPGVPVYPLLALGFISVALNPTFQLFQSKVQAEQRGMTFGLTNFAFFLVNVTLTVSFLVVFRMKAVGLVLAFAVTNAVFFLYSLAAFPREIHFGIHGPILARSLRYSLPLLPHMLAGWTIGMIDKLFLNSMAGAGSVGVYTVGFQVANVLGTITLAVNQAFGPWFFEQVSRGEEGFRRARRVTRVIIWFYSGSALFAGLFGPEIVMLMSSRGYHEGWIVLPPLLAGFVFNGIYYCVVGPLFLNQTKLVPVVTIISASVGLAANMILIPRFGMTGAALASLASNLAGAVLASVFSAAVTKRSLGGIGLYAIPSAVLALSSVVYFPAFRSGAFGLAVRLVLLAGGAAAAFIACKDELPELTGIMRGRR